MRKIRRFWHAYLIARHGLHAQVTLDRPADVVMTFTDFKTGELLIVPFTLAIREQR